jgi:hypothetical protein
MKRKLLASSFISKRPKTNFHEYLSQTGQKFENEIVKYIHNNIHNIQTISDKITPETCQTAIKKIKEGVPILHSIPFDIDSLNIRGVIDFLIRRDYLHLLYPAYDGVKDKNYVAIDIKFSTIPFKSDNVHILNSEKWVSYKKQLYIYTQAIGEIQGYTPRYAYILGRRYRYKNITDLNCLSNLGRIDYFDIDREVIQNKKLEIPVNNLSEIWNFNKKYIQRAISKGITDWRDPRLNSETIEIKSKTGSIIDKILDINRQEKLLMSPDKIESDIYNWREIQNELYLDFETFPDIFSDLTDIPDTYRTDFIFLIGVYYKEKYYSFSSDTATLEAEKEVMNRFIQFYENIGKPKIWYWHAEKYILNKVCKRHDIIFNPILSDLLLLFKNVPIVMKGCFKFGLKEIVKTMNHHKFINIYPPEDINGLEASLTAWKEYEKKKNDNEYVINIDKILEYNKFDVESIYLILTYLRTNK